MDETCAKCGNDLGNAKWQSPDEDGHLCDGCYERGKVGRIIARLLEEYEIEVIERTDDGLKLVIQGRKQK